MQKDEEAPAPYLEQGFKYEFQNQHQNVVHEVLKYDQIKELDKIDFVKYQATGINDAVAFSEPRSRGTLDQRILDYYVNNSYLRYVDTDEDPLTLDEKLNKA